MQFWRSDNLRNHHVQFNGLWPNSKSALPMSLYAPQLRSGWFLSYLVRAVDIQLKLYRYGRVGLQCYVDTISIHAHRYHIHILGLTCQQLQILRSRPDVFLAH